MVLLIKILKMKKGNKNSQSIEMEKLSCQLDGESYISLNIFLIFKFFLKSLSEDIFIDFRERKRGREGEGERRGERQREREKHRFVASHMYPDQGSNLQPFGAQDDAETNWRPGQSKIPIPLKAGFWRLHYHRKIFKTLH